MSEIFHEKFHEILHYYIIRTQLDKNCGYTFESFRDTVKLSIPGRMLKRQKMLTGLVFTPLITIKTNAHEFLLQYRGSRCNLWLCALELKICLQGPFHPSLPANVAKKPLLEEGLNSAFYAVISS